MHERKKKDNANKQNAAKSHACNRSEAKVHLCWSFHSFSDAFSNTAARCWYANTAPSSSSGLVKRISRSVWSVTARSSRCHAGKIACSQYGPSGPFQRGVIICVSAGNNSALNGSQSTKYMRERGFVFCGSEGDIVKKNVCLLLWIDMYAVLFSAHMSE
jgi:hypothetical protein